MQVQLMCELALSLSLSRACVAWHGRAGSRRWSWRVNLAAGSTCHRELPFPLAPSKPSQVLVPVQAVGIRHSGVSYQRSNRGRSIGIPWPIVPQLYLLNEGA